MMMNQDMNTNLNIYCRNCGYRLDNQIKCSKCKCEVVSDRVDTQKVLFEEKKEGKVLITILKVLFILYGVSFFVPYLRTVSGHLLLPTLVLSIYCKIKFPHDKFVEFAFISCIIYVVLYVLLILFLIFACMDLGGAF